MVIPEIKFQTPPNWQSFTAPRRVQEIYGISPTVAINQFTSKAKPESTPRKHKSPQQTKLHRALAIMVDQANNNLLFQGVDIHLSLTESSNGFILDIYDCTSNKLCAMIGERQVSLTDLPAMLKNLQEQAGLLFDRQS